MLNVAVAGVLGIMVGVFLVFFWITGAGLEKILYKKGCTIPEKEGNTPSLFMQGGNGIQTLETIP